MHLHKLQANAFPSTEHKEDVAFFKVTRLAFKLAMVTRWSGYCVQGTGRQGRSLPVLERIQLAWTVATTRCPTPE